MKTFCFDQKTKTLVCNLSKVSMKCHSSTCAFQEHVKECTILDYSEKMNPYWSILSNHQLVIISRYLIEEEEEEEEEEEDEEFDGEERDVKALAVKTEKDPLCYQNIKNSLKLSESVQMNGHRWMLHDQGHSHV